jgi:Lar family restriction alleviation protein
MTKKDKEVELKPCPFCGGEAEISEGTNRSWEVTCLNCGVGTYEIQEYSDTVACWNTRPDYEEQP